MKKKYLFIALAMGTFAFGQNVKTNVKCSKKCIKYYQEDTKGNTMHQADCTTEVRMADLDPCLFDKYKLTHPLHVEYLEMRKELMLLREIVEEQRESLKLIREAYNK